MKPENAAIAAYYRGIGWEDACAVFWIKGAARLKVREAFFNLYREIDREHQQPRNSDDQDHAGVGSAHLRAVPIDCPPVG